MRIHSLKLTSLALGLCALLGSAACGDDETTDSPDSGAEGGRVSRAGSGGKGGSGGKDVADDAGAPEGGKGGSGSSGDGECFDGEPKKTEDFLNRCTDSECEPFDNAERLPLLKDGKLPPLP